MADPTSVWNEVMQFLGLMQKPKMLKQWEKPNMEPRRTDFGMTYGKDHGPVERPEELIPGTFDSLAEQMGLASDDPHGLAAKMEAWKRQGRKTR